MMSFLTIRILAAAGVTWLVLGLTACGANAGKKSNTGKDKDASSDLTVHSPQQDQCNSQGMVYDSVLKPTYCTRYKMVSWRCHIDEIVSRVNSIQGSVMFKNNLGDLKTRGYYAAQCGEFDGETLVTFTMGPSTQAGASPMHAKTRYKVVNDTLSAQPIEYSGAEK